MTDTRPNAIMEARRVTQDGLIWPIGRADMTDRVQIILRMSEDAAALLRETGDEGVILDVDLVSFGWRRAQVEAHGRAAALAVRANGKDAA